MVKHEVLETLIDLANIFEKGFTITLDQEKNEYNQYSNTNKPYIVSHKPIITIKKYPLMNSTIYHKIDSLELNDCIIGGWLDSETNIYYIELNLAFRTKRHALQIAKTLKQKYVYNMNNHKSIEVKQ